MRRFFVTADFTKDRIVVTGSEARHITKVLRLRPGEQVIFFDGTGVECEAELEWCTEQEVRARVKRLAGPENVSSLVVTLVQSVAKGEKMDLIVQKATELGVARIIPLISERTVVRLNEEKKQEKVERWQRIAKEACKQCHRRVLPEITPVISWNQVFPLLGKDLVLFLSPEANGMSLKEVLRQNHGRTRVALLVGPEGGFSEKEVEEAKRAGFCFAHMGPRIMRTETASIAATAIIMYELGDVGN